MKTTYQILAIALLTLSFSCKNETSKDPVHIDTRNPMNEELTDTRNYEEEDGNLDDDDYTYEEKTADIDTNWNLKDPERQMRLYARFEMNDSQQQRYETALTEWMTADPENPYEQLSANDRIDAEAEILKDILDDEQFDRYKTWAADNDKR